MASRERREHATSEQPATTAAHDDEHLLRAAVAAARAGAGAIREMTPGRATLSWEEKSPSDFVSAVDRASEERIAATLGEHLPDARLVGEEGSPDLDRLADGVVVVADPLDGTTNFLHGFPAYAVSVGVLVDGSLRAGAILDVTRDELFTAVAGGGAWCDGAPIRVSSIDVPARALVGTGFPFKHVELIAPYMKQLPGIMAATSGIRRAGAAALDLAAVACGRFEAFWELMLQPWDIAAGLLIVREAGGIATDLSGAPARVAPGPLVTGNPAIHRWLLDHLTRTA